MLFNLPSVQSGFSSGQPAFLNGRSSRSSPLVPSPTPCLPLLTTNPVYNSYCILYTLYTTPFSRRQPRWPGAHLQFRPAGGHARRRTRLHRRILIPYTVYCILYTIRGFIAGSCPHTATATHTRTNARTHTAMPMYSDPHPDSSRLELATGSHLTRACWMPYISAERLI